ncbi:MAG: hypothetical protein PWQ57_1014 [Desulfovibrionales bacterium]|nr:hypothetical protein [Desulfovibrionales bacterium]
MQRILKILLCLIITISYAPAYAGEVYDSDTMDPTCIGGLEKSESTGNNSGRAIIDFEHNIFNGASGSLTMEWKVGSLMQEPVVWSRAKWTLTSVNVRHPRTGENVILYAKDLPSDVLDAVTIWNLKIFSSFDRGEVGYRFDQGAMAKAGGGWSFTVPGSPKDWDHFFVTTDSQHYSKSQDVPEEAKTPIAGPLSDAQSTRQPERYAWRFASKEHAKQWVAEGLRFTNHKLVTIGFDLNAVKAWLWEKDSKEAKQRKQQIDTAYKASIKKLEKERNTFIKQENKKSAEQQAEEFFDSFDAEDSARDLQLKSFDDRKREITNQHEEQLRAMKNSDYLKTLQRDSERKSKLAAEHGLYAGFREKCEQGSQHYFKREFKAKYGGEPRWGRVFCLGEGGGGCWQCWNEESTGNHATTQSECDVYQLKWNTRYDAAHQDFLKNGKEKYINECVTKEIKKAMQAFTQQGSRP